MSALLTPALLTLLSAAASPTEPPPSAPTGATSEPDAAESPAQAAATELDLSVDRRRRRVQIAGMTTLLGWAGVNILTGLAGNIATSADNPLRYAHQMNWAWNTVNLTLGAIGLRSAINEGPLRGSALRRKITRTRRIFAINALADVGYMLGGYLTWELGKDHESARLRGYGASVILQGAFLMAFDLGMVAAHERNRRRLDLALVPLTGASQGVALAGRF